MALPLRSRVAAWLRKKAIGYITPLASWFRIFEPYPFAFQQAVSIDRATVSAYWAVFACVTLIAKDISKLFPQVVQFNSISKIWEPKDQRKVLERPNRFQNYIEFLFDWVRCLLLHGNTYVLKERDAQRHIIRLYILDPCRVTPLITLEGDIYYQLATDNLSGLERDVVVPASEIIHDRFYTLHHPLIGVSPIFACGVSASVGVAIQNNSSKFFENMSRPSGMLLAPGAIDPADAATLKAQWETNFGGDNLGKVAVLGEGLKFEAMSVNAHDAQLIEQLKMTAEMVCACYHVPGYKIGVGAAPTVTNTAVLNQQYYDQCLQWPIEKLELRLAEGVELEFPFEVRLSLAGLLRMDPQARYASHNEAIQGGWKKPDECRREEDLPPVPGGDSCYLQQQNYSLAALAKRDSKEDPFGSGAAPSPSAPPASSAAEEDETEKVLDFLNTLPPENFFNA